MKKYKKGVTRLLLIISYTTLVVFSSGSTENSCHGLHSMVVDLVIYTIDLVCELPYYKLAIGLTNIVVVCTLKLNYVLSAYVKQHVKQ